MYWVQKGQSNSVSVINILWGECSLIHKHVQVSISFYKTRNKFLLIYSFSH